MRAVQEQHVERGARVHVAAQGGRAARREREREVPARAAAQLLAPRVHARARLGRRERGRRVAVRRDVRGRARDAHVLCLRRAARALLAAVQAVDAVAHVGDTCVRERDVRGHRAARAAQHGQDDERPHAEVSSR